jgi:DNA-binding beta-propeller fold protein YncE
MRMKNCERALVVIMLVSLVPQSGWANKNQPTKQVDTSNLVWPMPPDKPRVKWLEMWSNNFDIETRKKRGFLDKVAGVDDPNKTEPFAKPAGVAIDSKGRIFFASVQNAMLYILDKEHKQIIRFHGDKAVSFRSPVGVAIDSKDNLYVSDPQLHAVFKFDPQLRAVGQFGGEQGMRAPSYIALDEQRDHLYVADARLNLVLAYQLSTLEYIGFFGRPGLNNKKDFMLYPVGVAVNPKDGMIAVTDTGNCSVVLFDKNGKFVRRFGKQGVAPGDFVRPKGVAFDSEGNIWVADAGFSNVQIFNTRGQPLMFFGSSGHDPGQFYLPNGIFIDKNNRVYVSDQLNFRVQVFQFLGGN